MAGSESPRHYIMVADQKVALPEGVTVADWGLEKARRQNPRIRSIVGCLGLLDDVMESNYALLHCSPERLDNIWKTAQRVKNLMLDEVSKLLKESSIIPQVAETCERASLSLRMLRVSVLGDLNASFDDYPGSQLLELRKILCISIGQMYTYLQDTLGAILASDPRGQHDADYFLSRRFPRDIEEAEWLFFTVENFREYISNLEVRRKEELAPCLSKMGNGQASFGDSEWAAVSVFLNELLEGLTPKLREILALRGIRFYEMEIIDAHSFEIPASTREIQRLWTLIEDIKIPLSEVAVRSEAPDQEAIQFVDTARQAVLKRMAARLTEIDNALRDLVTFVPLWLSGIKRRRALFLGHGDDSKISHPPVRPKPQPST